MGIYSNPFSFSNIGLGSDSVPDSKKAMTEGIEIRWNKIKSHTVIPNSMFKE